MLKSSAKSLLGALALSLGAFGSLAGAQAAALPYTFRVPVLGLAVAGSASSSTTPTTLGRFVYAANGSVLVCQAATDGTLSSCLPANSGLSGIWGVDVSGSFAYLADNSSGAIDICSIASDGTLSGCAQSPSNIDSGPMGVTISGGYLYAVDEFSNVVESCAVQPDGSLAPCQANSMSFSVPQGFAISGTQAYVGDAVGRAVYACSAAAGTLSGCTSVLSGLQTVSDMADTGTHLYVASGSVQVCTIGSGGTLSNCAATAAGYSNVRSLRIKGFLAYLGDGSSNTTAVCQVASNADLDNCVSTSASSIGGAMGIGLTF